MTGTRTISILQINDTHGYIEAHPEVFYNAGGVTIQPAGGYARLARLVRDARRENSGGVLLLDNGDTLHGTYPAVQTQGQALVPLLNALGIDAMTAHWEFAYGPQVFKQRASELNYPVLALNVRQKDTGDLFFPASMVKEIAGLRLGIIGLASNIVDKTMPPHFSEGLEFTLGKDELPAAIAGLRESEKVDLVIVLSHLGFPQDVQLAKDVSGIDILLSGHTHHRLYAPVRQGQTLIIQSGSHGSFLGRLDVEVEAGPNGAPSRIRDIRHRLIQVSSEIAPEPEMQARVDAALAPYQAMLDEVVGETNSILHRGFNLEAPMDTLLLRALQEQIGARLAFSNGWRYGAPITAGQITLNDLYNIIPVNPPVSTVDLSGAELWEMLEETLEHTYAHDPYRQMGGYLKRALGLNAYIKVENPRGQRIQQLFVGQEEVRPGATYPAAFVTEQGVPPKYGHNRQKTSTHAIDALRHYLKEHSPVEVGHANTFVLI